MNIKKMPNGRYQARFHAPGGKHPQKTFDKKQDAVIWVTENLRAIRLNSYVGGSARKRKLNEVYADYLDTKQNLAPKSIDSIESLWRYHIAPTLGTYPIGAITLAVAQKWATTAVNGPKAYTSAIRIEKAVKQLSEILDFSVDNQYLARNPLRKSNGKVFTLVTGKTDKRRPKRFLTPAELTTLAQHCGRFQPLVMLAGICGLRFAELIGLRPCDLNFATNTLTLSSSLSEVSGKFYRKNTKTGQTRQIKLPDFLNEMLRTHCAEKLPTELIFANKRGNPLSGRNFVRDFFEPAILAAGIPRLTPKDLRNTAASIAISSGANVLAVSNMLGHSDPSITLRIYSHLFNEDQDILANAIGDMFAKSA